MGNVKVTVHNERNSGKEETDLGWGPQPRNAAEGTAPVTSTASRGVPATCTEAGT